MTGLDTSSFWADGNWGFNRIRQRTEEAQLLAREARITQQERDEEARNKLAAALWQMEMHPGVNHCSSCQYEDPDWVIGCCCLDKGKVTYALDNPEYNPKYPPVNGKVPEIFEKWGPNTQERYLERYKSELGR